MKYIVIGICIAVVAIIVALLIYKAKRASFPKRENIPDEDSGTLTEKQALKLYQSSKRIDEFDIPIEMLPVETISDESKLIEITDSKILAHVNNLVPGLAQAGVTGANAVQAAKVGSEVLYRAIIPAGAKLTNSRATKDAFRGFYRGPNRIRGHADLVAVQTQKGTAAVANAASAAMSVASMVVGQYYMTQINAELGKIDNEISKISGFQDNEFRSHVFSLVAHVKNIADFRGEILENDDLRKLKITQLDSLEVECTQLLGQANLTLADFAKKNNLDYTSYEKELKEAQNWYMYQKTLLEVLYEISDLKYALHMGTASREQCIALLPKYTRQVEDAQKRLTSWHQDTVQRLGIDTDEIRRKRDGFDGLIHSIPGLIKEDFNFKSIDEKTVDMIKTQTSGQASEHSHTSSDLYDEDVQLIAKDGKIYYLPPSKIE